LQSFTNPLKWLIKNLEQVKGGGDANGNENDAMQPTDRRLTTVITFQLQQP
jgi:hypothetical protein